MSPAGRPKGTATGRRPRVNITLDDKHLDYLKKRNPRSVSAAMRAVLDETIQREQGGKK